MSLYLGRDKVGVSHTITKSSDDDVHITQEQFEDLQDAIAFRVGDYVERTVPQMITAAKNDFFQTRNYEIMSDYHESSWVRPQGWPDLDSLNLQMAGDDFIYMTYDNTRGRAAVAWHIEKAAGGVNILVEIGHIANGVFTAYDTISGSSNNYVRWLDNSIDGDYPVVKITGSISLCYSYSVSANGATQHYRKQPVLERIAWVPHLIRFVPNYSSSAWGLFTLQREKIANGEGTALVSLYYAWAYSRDLEELDLSGLHTPNVTNMNYTFAALLKIRKLDLRHFNVKKVTTLANCFDSSRNLKEIDITGWETPALTNIAAAFGTCLSLKVIKGIEDLNVAKVTSFASTFVNCRSLESLDLTKWVTTSVTNLSSCFASCYNLQELDLSSWTVNKVTNVVNLFNACYSLKRINTNGWEVGTLTTIGNIFSNCQSLEKVDVSWLKVTSSCTNIYQAFYQCYALTEINLPAWDVSGLSSSNNTANSVFYACYSLKKITGISNWNFQLTNSLTNMFANCYSLQELDVSNWNVSTVTNLSSTFAGCSSLKTLDLTNWDPTNCTTFASMFSGCSSLLSVGDISGWTTSKCASMATMFRYCYSLKEFPNISNWNFSSITTLDNMFSECYSIEEINWQNANLPKCTILHNLFRYCYNLKKVNVGGWSIPAVTNNTNYYPLLGDCWCLRDVEGIIIPSTYTRMGFSGDENLSHESLLFILNALPTTTSGHTLYLSNLNINSLTAEEKAIATNKNWTLAN